MCEFRAALHMGTRNAFLLLKAEMTTSISGPKKLIYSHSKFVHLTLYRKNINATVKNQNCYKYKSDD